MLQGIRSILSGGNSAQFVQIGIWMKPTVLTTLMVDIVSLELFIHLVQGGSTWFTKHYWKPTK